jgi:predicted dehydrogenase
MKLLFIGIGSIGRKHLKNCLELGYNDVYIFSKSFCDYNLVSRDRCFIDLGVALTAHVYDAIFVNTPTSSHIEIIKQLIDTPHRRIYVEKPISDTMENIDLIAQSRFGSKEAMVVGYDLRFDPGISKCISWINGGAIGKPVSFNAFVGSFLPDWRPRIDYKQSMSAIKKLGGGVMLDLAHEFDYLHFLFGKLKRLACFYQNSGVLEIETEDISNVIFEFKSGISGSLSLDYLQREYTRYCRITGSEGSLLWNYAANEVTLFRGKDVKEVFNYSEFSRDDRFKSILSCFLNNSFTDKRLASANEAVYSLDMILKAKQSSETNSVIIFE